MKKYISKLYDYIKQNYKMLIMDFLIIAVVLFVCYYPLPYVIYRPGGLINLNDRIQIENTSNIDGSYNMTYVTMAKGTLSNLFISLFFEGWDIQKEEGTLFDGDYKENFRLSQLDMQNSVDLAKLVAFKKAGLDVNIESKYIIVTSIENDAITDLKKFDKITKIEGVNLIEIDDVREIISGYDIGDKLSLDVINEDGEEKRFATVYEYQNRKVIGITFFEMYDFATDLDVNFKFKTSEAGSSGGFMMTLTMYDYLVKNNIANGKKIAGTGTIDINGNVGEIGGIKYKLLGAEKRGADIYLAPNANCKEAVNVYNRYDLSFELKCVGTFDEAINYLNSIN